MLTYFAHRPTAVLALTSDERGGRTVDVHVRWRPSKIEADPDQPTCLATVRSVG